jgi:cell division inhibitor SepF
MQTKEKVKERNGGNDTMSVLGSIRSFGEKFRTRDGEYDGTTTYLDDGGAAVEANRYDSYDVGMASSERVMRFAETESRTHKIVKVKGTDYNTKRKEAANYFKNGHVVYLNMDEANKEIMSPVLNFLGGMAYALDGEIKRLSTSVYAIIPCGDEIGGDIYGDEYSAEYRMSDEYI